MEARLTKTIEQYAVRKRIGLWRTHPSFFFVSLFYFFEGLVVGSLFTFDNSTTIAYKDLFRYIPEDVFGFLFIIGALVIGFALISRRHVWLRIGAGIMLIPNMMMVANFLFLSFSFYGVAIIVATFKWGLTCIMLGLMMFEPFVNPNSAR